MLGTEPGLADALAYYLVWFLRHRMAKGEEFLRQFENLAAWEKRIKDIGHGKPRQMSDLQALEIAKNASPKTPELADPGDPLGLDVGDPITIEPAAGGPRVGGTLHSLSANQLAILRLDDQVGRVCVHFPRVGYRVKRI